MHVGIMGGTLNPIHNGHLAIAEAVLKQAALDEILFIPLGDAPHKHLNVTKWQRYDMVKCAVAGRPAFEVCDVEVMREGKTYTVDTLSQLRAERPQDEFFYIIGEDTLQVLDSWRNFGTVAKLTRFLAVHRPGCDGDFTRQKLFELRETYGADVALLDLKGPDISSSEVRLRSAMGEDISALVPPGVAAYIRRNGLYLCDMTPEEIDDKLHELLNEKRYAHTMGVAETAVELATIHGADVERARLAGLLHDCAKYMDRTKMFAYVRENCPDVDETEMSMTSVVHAPAGMLMARDVFGVRDPAILSAIRKHTLGDREMSALDLIIYIADFIEPNRESFDGLEEARALAMRDLRACARYCAELSGEYVLKKGYVISPKTIAMIENLS